MTTRVFAISPPRVHFFLAVVACGCLLTAFVAQEFFDIIPCDLCLYERWAYYGVILVALGSFLVRRVSLGLLRLDLAILTLGFLLTAYHVGLEQKWIPASLQPSFLTCQQKGPAPTTLAELKARLGANRHPSCSEVTWWLFGISATWWNLALLAALLVSVGGYVVSNPPTHRR